MIKLGQQFISPSRVYQQRRRYKSSLIYLKHNLLNNKLNLNENPKNKSKVTVF